MFKNTWKLNICSVVILHKTLFQNSHFVLEIYQPLKSVKNQFCIQNLGIDMCFQQQQKKRVADMFLGSLDSNKVIAETNIEILIYTVLYDIFSYLGSKELFYKS